MLGAGERTHVASDEMVGVPWARLDDLREGTARRLQETDEVLVATRPEAGGRRAGGGRGGDPSREVCLRLAYEAAPGLDPTLVVHPRAADGPRWPGWR